MRAGIYALLDQGRPFGSPAELLKAVDLYDLTQQSMVRSAALAQPRPPSRPCRMATAGCRGMPGSPTLALV